MSLAMAASAMRARLGGSLSVAAAAAAACGERGRRLGLPLTGTALAGGSQHRALAGVAVGHAGGAGLLFAAPALKPAVCEASAAAASAPAVKEAIPESLKLSGGSKRGSGPSVKLYQYESCPFCRKVRSCLDYLKQPYEIVEVHPLNKAETKQISPDYKKVPVLVVEGESEAIQVRDSKAIVNALLAEKNVGVAAGVPLPKATASTGKMWVDIDEKLSPEEQWVLWTDKVLAQCIVLNVYRTLSESAETFKYLFTHPQFSWYAQYSASFAGSAVMWTIAKKRKKKYEVQDERQALYEAVGQIQEAVSAGPGKFLGGDRPGAADFNAFGILRAAEGCRTERDMETSCPAAIQGWFSAMSEVVGPSCAVNASSVKRG